MPTLMDYLAEQGQEPMETRPFCALDSLALTQIVYMPMEGFLEPGQTATVAELAAWLAHAYPEGLVDPFQRKRFDCTLLCARCARFAQLTLSDYLNHVDAQQETQFCACVFALPDGSRYVSIRGTDLTLAGWKEDLNMSFMPVPAQREATEYLDRAAGAFSGPLRVGGHSKGGHLALFAAAHAAPETQARLADVYSFDGQGVDEATLLSEGYARVAALVQSYIPQSSVVGMLLCYHPVYRVVKSTALGLFQHDVLTWQVAGCDFEILAGLDLGTRMADEALRQWIDRLSLPDRRLLTDTTFRLISTLDPETIDPLVQDLPASSFKLMAAFRHLEPETRAAMRRMLGDLFSSGANEAVRTLLPGTFRRFVETPATALPLAERVRARSADLLHSLRPGSAEDAQPDEPQTN
ncbi:MAG: Mbeg1-like protein [Candidatus Limiplasma sp.]|nr:Mbeg1-like protein [Candidatus Limiplasma sp.]